MNRLERKLKWLAERPEEKDFDWQARKEEWIQRVDALYSDVESWLKPYQESGYLKTERTDITVSEEYLGDYQIQTLKILIEDRTVVFEPYARNVIGAQGRIHLYLWGYKSDALLLVLIEHEEGRPEWEVWKHREFGARMPFNQELLEDILYRWI